MNPSARACGMGERKPTKASKTGRASNRFMMSWTEAAGKCSLRLPPRVKLFLQREFDANCVKSTRAGRLSALTGVVEAEQFRRFGRFGNSKLRNEFLGMSHAPSILARITG